MKLKNKLVLIGDSGVGKTSVVQRYLSKTFNQSVYPTVGAAFSKATYNFNDKTEEVQIWDTAGEERFQSMTPIYIQNAFGAIIVFDVTNRDTFEHIPRWISIYKNIVDSPFIICANKTDIESESKISESEIEEFANSVSSTYVMTSALTGDGLDVLFSEIFQRSFEYKSEPVKGRKNDVDIEETNGKSYCC